LKAFVALLAALLLAGCTLPSESPSPGPGPSPGPTPGPTPSVSGNLTVVMLNISLDGDAIIIEAENFTAVNDAGQFKRNSDKVIARLQADGRSYVDLIIPSHHHADHIGGLVRLMDEYTVIAAWDSGSTYSTDIYTGYISKARARNFTVVKRGDRFVLGGAVFEVLSPTRPNQFPEAQENDNSIVFKVIYGNATMLFEGDCELDCEADILSSGLDVRADVLKVAHHGSKSSSGGAFLTAVRPRIAVIGSSSKITGLNETLAKLAALNATVYQTYEDGDIVLTTDGASWNVVAG
jgi:competence protein ComEC